MRDIDAILTTEALSIGYSSSKGKMQEVQHQLNLTLRSHALTALLGPNGAGKSTLLRTICGLQKPISGEISLMGRDLTTLSATQRAKQISVVLTHHADSEQLTVKEIVSIGRHPYTNWLGILDKENERIVEKALSTVKIEHLAEREISQLSDGEKQRVWIAKALAQDTPLIFLDEPTSHLDYPNRIEIFKLLKDLANSGKSILISTHELDLAMQFADQLWVMSPNVKQGVEQGIEQGVEQGTPQEIDEKGTLASVLGFRQNPR